MDSAAEFVFPPVHVTRTVSEGKSLRLGELALTAHLTPGHTEGNTTWASTSCEARRCLHLVDVGSLSAPDYKLVGNPKYPDIVKDYDHSFALIDPAGCRAYAQDARANFKAQLAKQRVDALPAK